MPTLGLDTDPVTAKPRPAGAPPPISSGLFGQGQDIHSQLPSILAAGTDYANYITATETDRYNKSNDVLARGRASFNQASMTDQDIARMYSGASSRANAAFSGNLNALRAATGASGQTGGAWQQGLATRYAAQRAASLTDATRSLYEKRVESDMADRMARWNADQAVAAGLSRDPSVAGLDWLGTAGTLSAGLYGIDRQADAASQAAGAQRDSGKMSGIGGIIGGIASIF